MTRDTVVECLRSDVSTIRRHTKFLAQTLRVMRELFGSCEPTEESVPFLATGISVTLTGFLPWSLGVRHSLNGFLDYEWGWADGLDIDWAKEVSKIAEAMVIDINTIENIGRGDWSRVAEACVDLFERMEEAEGIE